jgi:hypothetical protein
VADYIIKHCTLKHFLDLEAPLDFLLRRHLGFFESLDNLFFGLRARHGNLLREKFPLDNHFKCFLRRGLCLRSIMDARCDELLFREASLIHYFNFLKRAPETRGLKLVQQLRIKLQFSLLQIHKHHVTGLADFPPDLLDEILLSDTESHGDRNRAIDQLIQALRQTGDHRVSPSKRL